MPTAPADAIVTRLVFAPFRNSRRSPPVEAKPAARRVNLFSELELAGRKTSDDEAVEPVELMVNAAEADDNARIEPAIGLVEPIVTWPVWREISFPVPADPLSNT